MKGKRYRILYERKVRGNSKGFSEKYLLKKAEEIFQKIKDKKAIKEEAKRLGNISVRIDLTGTPEVSFIIRVKNGKLGFIADKGYCDAAVGMRKEYFIQLINNPPKYGNMKRILFDNVFLKRGSVRDFMRLRPIFINALLEDKD
ncbi:MAG: hypothetical protein ABIH55_01775 [Nanoarchaeota archaeon]